MRRHVVLLAVVALFVAALAVPAFAQGQVERGPEHARSLCSYSGLNDDPVEGGRVQSYGQIVKQGGKSEVPSPGFACNPNNIPLK